MAETRTDSPTYFWRAWERGEEDSEAASQPRGQYLRCDGVPVTPGDLAVIGRRFLRQALS